MKCKCLQCGKYFEVAYPSLARKFCTSSCSTTYRWAHTESCWVKFECKTCGKEFKVRRSDHRIKEGKQIKYCSPECSHLGSITGRIVTCPVCGKEFYTTRTRFCSQSCVIEHRKKHEHGKTDLDLEHWKPTSVFPDRYYVSDKGEIYSVASNKLLSPGYNQKGYKICALNCNGKTKYLKVHRLVAQAFIPNPENKPEVDHINGNRTDNRVENLRWVTSKENARNPLTYKKLVENGRMSMAKIHKKRKETKTI